MPVTSPQDFKAAAAKRRKTTELSVEGVGTIRFRALSAGAAHQFQAEVKKAQQEGRDPEQLAFTLIARSWVDEHDEPWMPEAEGEQFARDLDPETYGAIAKAVLQLNGLDVGAVESAEKN